MRILALTAKQKMFVANYIVDLNATQAAVKSGYSVKTAQEQSSRLLSNVMIQEAIQGQMEARAQRTLVTADYVINGIKSVADNTEKDADRLKAYELLGKHLKLFTDKTELTGKDGEELTIKVTIKDE